ILDRLPDDLDGWRGRAALQAGVEAPVLAVRRLLGIPLDDPLPPLDVRLGTTKGTNALLTRTGAATALAVTAPFGDLLRIGDQTRPDLFDLTARRSPPLAMRSVEIVERIDAQGEVLCPLDVRDAEQKLIALRGEGIRSLAICLMHSYSNPVHEEQLMELARRIGFDHVSASHALMPLIEIVPRAHTTVVDAYVGPVVQAYLARLHDQFQMDRPGPASAFAEGGEVAGQSDPSDQRSVPGSSTGNKPLYVMTSAGGLVHWQDYAGKDSILSGPAGGVAALYALWQSVRSLPNHPTAGLIGLDMGGTSTDVSRASDRMEIELESRKAGVPLLTPTLPIETVASGGGSICWFDGVALRVGPQSAGADPGPACYGQGGPLTITDLNVFLGRIPPQQFPFPLDEGAVQDRLRQLQAQVQPKFGRMELHELASGLRRIANEQMAGAVRTVTIAQGADPREHALVGFGGAAGQHICEIADLLGVATVVDVPHAGLLSAWGMGYAPVQLDAVLPVYTPLHACRWSEWLARVDGTAAELGRQVESRRTPGNRQPVECDAELEVRYVGMDTTLTVPLQPVETVSQRFEERYRNRYGYLPSQGQIEAVALRIVCRLPSGLSPPVWKSVPCDAEMDLPGVVGRNELPEGVLVRGPVVVMNDGSTLVIDPGWSATVLAGGTLWLRREEGPVAAEYRQVQGAGEHSSESVSMRLDPVFRECYAARLAAIATQMGTVLQQTARSVNVKQRRDYSCAVFDSSGQLLANAPHVPVHLGAMGETVRSVIDMFPDVLPGDMFLTNDPYRGGSHLPDLTVVAPVVDAAGSIAMWVANRAHHADIGGIAPGSMSCRTRQLGEEGVVIEPMHLIRSGTPCFDQVQHLLASAPYPPRNIEEVLADVAAQAAANRRGIELLQEYAAAHSWPILCQYARHLLDAAAQRAEQVIRNRLQGEHHFLDHLDHGIPIAATLRGDRRGVLSIDFSGTGDVDAGNFNANPSIVRAAVMYVLRCLMQDDFPLNEGVMQRVDLRIPTGLLNPARASELARSPAVAAGNVETSQRVVDVLLGAIGAAAASQGTMNNVLFGNQRFGFYETICGGAGATPEADGESGVHTHMTNTRLTDPEVLESRYPVRLRRFGLRSGSGGRGRRRGGEGVEREIEFLQPVVVGLLTGRRNPAYPPYGLEGGDAGMVGENWLLRPGEQPQRLPACCEIQAEAGDRLRILTPGGGGYGVPPTE
ncbi:MAG: hydantoinase, partial [Planctomycetota bacterium]